MYPKGDPYLRAFVVARQLSLLGYRCQPEMEAVSMAHPLDFVFENPPTRKKLYLSSQAVSVSISSAKVDFSQLEGYLELFKRFRFITPGSLKPSTQESLRDKAQWILPIAWEDNRKEGVIFADGKFRAVGLLVLTPGQKFQWIGMTTNSFMLALTGCLSQLGFQQIEPQDSDYLPLSPHVELSSLLKTDNLGLAEAEENFQVFLSNSHGYLSRLREAGCAELGLSQSFGPLTFSDHPIVSDPASAAVSPDFFHEGLVIVKSFSREPADLQSLLRLQENPLLGGRVREESPELDAKIQGLIDELNKPSVNVGDITRFCHASFLWVLRALLNNTQSTEDVPEPSASAASAVPQTGVRRRLSDVFDRAAEAPVRFDAFFSEYTRTFNLLINTHGGSSTFAAFVSRVVLEMICQHIDPAVLERIQAEFLRLVDRISLLERMKLEFLSFYWNTRDSLVNRNITGLQGIKEVLEIVFQKPFSDAHLFQERIETLLDEIIYDWCYGLEPMLSDDSESQPHKSILFFLENLMNSQLLCIVALSFVEECLSGVPETLKTHSDCCFGGYESDEAVLHHGRTDSLKKSPTHLRDSVKKAKESLVPRPAATGKYPAASSLVTSPSVVSSPQAGSGGNDDSLRFASFVREGPGEVDPSSVTAGQSGNGPSPAALPLRQPPPPPPRLSPAQPAVPAAAAEFQSASLRATGTRASGALPPVRKSSFWRGFGRVILGGFGLTLIGIGVLAVLAVTHGAAVAPIAAAMPWLVNTVIHPMIAAMGVTGSVTVVSTISFSLGIPSLVEAASPSFFERCCGCFRPRRDEVRQEQASSAPASTSTGAVRSALKSSPPGAVQRAGLDSPPAGAPSGQQAGATQPKEALVTFAKGTKGEDGPRATANAGGSGPVPTRAP